MENRRPNFSVIVPFFNARRYLGTCIEHLLRQDYEPEDVEIILVDNASTDGSSDVVRQYPGVRLLTEAKRGSYAARNRALREARGSLLAFTDADCAAHPQWLRNLDRALRNSGASLVLGQRRPVREDSLVAMLADYENCKVEYFCRKQDPRLYYGFTGNMAVRRELLDRHGPFLDRARGADTIFVRRVVDAESCAVVSHCPDAIVTHLELDGVRAYWKKALTYGHSMRMCRDIIARRAFTISERVEVFRCATRCRPHPLRMKVLLFAALSVGLAAWGVGTLCALAAPRPS